MSLREQQRKESLALMEEVLELIEQDNLEKAKEILEANIGVLKMVIEGDGGE